MSSVCSSCPCPFISRDEQEVEKTSQQFLAVMEQAARLAATVSASDIGF